MLARTAAPAVAVTLILAGCGAPLKVEHERAATVIFVQNRADVAKCVHVGTVKAWSLIGLPPPGYDPYPELRSRAAAAGGTHVLLANSPSGFTGASASGEAYRCP